VAATVLALTEAVGLLSLVVTMGKRHPQVVAAPRAARRREPELEISVIEVNLMLHPSDAERTHAAAVRGGHAAPVTCATCGCRLTPTGDVWFHFNPIGGRDARGCRIACADAAHDASGRTVSLAV
jgi:hypothetical protein